MLGKRFQLSIYNLAFYAKDKSNTPVISISTIPADRVQSFTTDYPYHLFYYHTGYHRNGFGRASHPAIDPGPGSLSPIAPLPPPPGMERR